MNVRSHRFVHRGQIPVIITWRTAAHSLGLALVGTACLQSADVRTYSFLKLFPRRPGFFGREVWSTAPVDPTRMHAIPSRIKLDEYGDILELHM
jgi:hypothetical protein